jgi:hypothetical protein
VRIIFGAQFLFHSFRFGMKIYQIQYTASKHKQKLRLAAATPQSSGVTDLSCPYHLRSSVPFYSFVFGVKTYQIHYSTSKHIQNLRLAADTPQSFGITDFSRAYHLRSSILFLIFCFWDENISDTLFSIQT